MQYRNRATHRPVDVVTAAKDINGVPHVVYKRCDTGEAFIATTKAFFEIFESLDDRLAPPEQKPDEHAILRQAIADLGRRVEDIEHHLVI